MFETPKNMKYKFKPGTLIEITDEDAQCFVDKELTSVHILRGTIGVIIETYSERPLGPATLYRVLMENKILIVSEYCFKRLGSNT